MFKETYGESIHMPGVISGGAREYYIPHDPWGYTPTTKSTTKSTAKSTVNSTEPSTTPKTIDKPVSKNMLLISLGLCILLFFTLGFLVIYCYHEF